MSLPIAQVFCSKSIKVCFVYDTLIWGVFLYSSSETTMDVLNILLQNLNDHNGLSNILSFILKCESNGHRRWYNARQFMQNGNKMLQDILRGGIVSISSAFFKNPLNLVYQPPYQEAWRGFGQYSSDILSIPKKKLIRSICPLALLFTISQLLKCISLRPPKKKALWWAWRHTIPFEISILQMKCCSTF